MPDLVLIEGDRVVFMPVFGNALVVVQPGSLEASGPATLNDKKICIDGDEKKLSVPGCSYMAPPYVIPGSGTLKIAELGHDQKARKAKTGGKAMLLRGSKFTATFEVQSPAKQPPSGAGPPIPDATPQYLGQGMFITNNVRFRVT